MTVSVAGMAAARRNRRSRQSLEYPFVVVVVSSPHEGLSIPVAEKTAALQVRSSAYGRVGFVSLLDKALSRDATRRIRFDVHAASLLHSMVLH